MFLLSAPVLILGGNVLIFPLLIWHDIPYLPNEHYCYIVLLNVRSTLWIIFLCYLTPIVCLFIIHIRITIFLRQQPNNLAIRITQRQKRDLMVIRRIFINLSVLFVAGLPGTIVSLMPFVTGVKIAFDQRITLCALEISLAVLSVEMILMTPQLKELMMKRRGQQNQVTIIPGMIQRGTTLNAQ